MKRWQSKLLPTAVLACVACVLAYPFVWMLFAGFKTDMEVYKPLQVLPKTFSGEYYQLLFSGKWINFSRVFFNSFVIAAVQATVAVFATAMVGFVLARYRFRGKSAVLVVALLSVLIPRQVIALPLFSWLIDLHLFDTLWGVILPGTVSGLGVLFFTQVFRQFPESLLEAGRLEGASEWRLFWAILPLANAALLTYGMIHFILASHEHLIPLLVLHRAENQTLPIALSSLRSSGMRYPEAVIMAASTLTLIPNVLVFSLMYRRARSSLSELTS